MKEMAQRLKQHIKYRYKKFSLKFLVAPPIVRPIFIVGTVRSSTTLMAQCLGNHPSICHPRHVHFELSPEWCELANIDIGAPASKRQNCPSLNASDAKEDICQTVRKGFAKIHIEAGGSESTRFLSKSPHLWNKLSFLHRIFPDTSLIITTRDILSTVISTKYLWIDLEKRSGVKHYLPQDPNQCWRCIWPHSPDEVDPCRTFPGGDISVLAEYWLRTYKTIERDIGNFSTVLLIKHHDFVENPGLIMTMAQKVLDIPIVEYPLPVKIDSGRNERWRHELTEQEKKTVKIFIEENYNDINSLKYADKTIANI
jgi:hypothetical protein